MLVLLAALIASPVSTEITLPAEPAPLIGTLVMPEGPPKAAVLFVPSPLGGTADGDEAYGYIGSAKRTLGEQLAEQGIASVRYAAPPLPDTASDLSDYGQHIVGWAGQLADNTAQSCVWLASYYQSTLVSHAVARDNPKICGLVAFTPAITSPIYDIRIITDFWHEKFSELVQPRKAALDDLDRQIAQERNRRRREMLMEIRTSLEPKDGAATPEDSLADLEKTRQILSANENGEVSELTLSPLNRPISRNEQRYYITAHPHHLYSLEGWNKPTLVIVENVASPSEIESVGAYKEESEASIMVFERLARPSMGPVYAIDDYIPDLPRVPETGVVKAVADFILTPR